MTKSKDAKIKNKFKKEITDKLNRDRRSGIDRRKFSFVFFIPERRNRFDRRIGNKSIRLIRTN